MISNRRVCELHDPVVSSHLLCQVSEERGDESEREEGIEECSMMVLTVNRFQTPPPVMFFT